MKTLILGLDAFDAKRFEELSEQGQLPNLKKLVQTNGYRRFEVSNPPQSEVSWTSIASGLNPGSHGIFDFVHRSPSNYTLYVSLLPTGKSMGGIQFTRPSNVKTIFDTTVDQGYQASSLWWPATFPAKPESPVRSLPGLGTPDIQGRLGIGTLFTSNPDLSEVIGKTPVRRLESDGSHRYKQVLEGPMLKAEGGKRYATIDMEILVKDDRRVDIRIGKQILPLTLGQWSPIIELSFKINWMLTVGAITRLVLTQIEPYVQIYALPLQIHPLHSPWRYGSPAKFVKDAWKTSGPFLTLGWPQDTTGLEDGCINDDQFLGLCESIVDARFNLLSYELSHFHEGLLASVFDSLDRIQHMFWHTNPEIINRWYVKLDNIVGKVNERLQSGSNSDTRLLIVSDHGFGNFEYKVHLNRWLVQNGYLDPGHNSSKGDLKNVDWLNTHAYAIGLNSIYINQEKREGKGIVPVAEKSTTSEKIRQELLKWIGPDNRPVVQKAWLNSETFDGQLSDYGPDIVVGFSPGYRASSETGLGAWEAESIVDNKDHWGADHCFDPQSVPGVLFGNFDMSNFPSPSYRDIPALAIGASPDSRGASPPSEMSDEDQESLEERLKSLGYL